MHNLPKSLSFWQLICYGVLTTPLAMGGLALVIFIPTFYAVDMGLGLATVGAVFVFGRIFDVITDPLIGHFSDQTRSRYGARKPWMMFGLPFFCLATWFLLMPPEGSGIIFLIFVSAAYFLFYTIVDVPYSSIGLEISPHVHERSMLASSKAVFQVIGAITAASIPFVL
ncbi:MAG: MFS transporter, partial [Lentilitoribacter sp.]